MADESPVSKLEQRMWTGIVGVAMLLGGWWLQNQYQTMLRITEEHGEYVKYAASIYVHKDNMNYVVNRLDRIEQKIDNIATTAIAPRAGKFQSTQGD
jgi:hypothetical protein